jgi:hypothetical protein
MDRMNPPRRLADVWLLSHHQALIVPLSSDLKGGSTSTRLASYSGPREIRAVACTCTLCRPSSPAPCELPAATRRAREIRASSVRARGSRPHPPDLGSECGRRDWF